MANLSGVGAAVGLTQGPFAGEAGAVAAVGLTQGVFAGEAGAVVHVESFALDDYLGGAGVRWYRREPPLPYGALRAG